MRVVLLSALIGLGAGANAQRASRPDDPNNVPPPKPGELFVGEWKWASGSEVFHLKLSRNPAWQHPNDPRHRIVAVVTGQHSYTRNGVVVEQSIIGNVAPPSLFGRPENNSTITMGFRDLTRNKHGDVTLTLVPGNPDQLQWELEVKEMVYVYPDVPPAAGFTVPTTMTLTRQ